MLNNKTLLIVGWDKWQSYRKDRGTPPWIKIHRNLMTNQEWSLLTDAEKGQLVSMWIIAADKKGVIPSDANILRKFCQLDSKPNISKFIELGFLCQCDDTVTTTRQPGDAPETETETETERINPELKEKTKTIITHLNEKSGKNFKSSTKKTKEAISARIREGFGVEDFKKVINSKVLQWQGDKVMEEFIRPETLFGTKFESYRQAAPEESEWY